MATTNKDGDKTISQPGPSTSKNMPLNPKPIRNVRIPNQLELNQMDYPKLQKLTKDLGLKPDSKKTLDLKKAILKEAAKRRKDENNMNMINMDT